MALSSSALRQEGDTWHHHCSLFSEGFVDPIVESGKELTLPPVVPVEPVRQYSRATVALAFGVAAISDVITLGIGFLTPVQIGLDLLTAFALFWILGRRWALLPGFIAEAIPGLDVFPVWVLVVLSIVLYDGFKKPRK